MSAAEKQEQPLLSSESEFLSESAWTTLSRDLLEVKGKFVDVFNPKANLVNSLKDWDLWGPLLCCLFISTTIAASSSDSSLAFAGIFSISAAGGAASTISAVLLGSSLSFFQIICAYGYCLVPLCLTSLITVLLPWTIAKAAFILSGASLSFYSFYRFLRGQVPEDRALLCFFPFGVVYTVISWLSFE